MLYVTARLIGVLVICALGLWSLNAPVRAQANDYVVPPLNVGLPLAAQTRDGAGCKTESELADENAKAYVSLLAARFNTDVTLCLTETPEDVVALAEQGEVNFAWAEQASVSPILESWRPVLTLRENTGLGRAPFVLFTLAGESGSTELGAIEAANIGFLDRPPEALNIDHAQRVLVDFGMAQEDLSEPRLFGTQSDLFEAVETAEIQAGILESGTWGRACGVLDPASTFCDHLEILIYDRSRALNAFMIPNETEKERHFRLVGVHIALHLEAPEVYEWISQGRGEEFEPTEAAAMLPKSSERAIAF